MALKARIIHLKSVPAGACTARDDLSRTPAPTIIATVRRYADGYRRLLSSRGEMLVGRPARARRRPGLSVDLTMLDVGAVPDSCIEDEVIIFSRQGNEFISADDLARELGTINYEIVCDLTARVPRALSKQPIVRQWSLRMENIDTLKHSAAGKPRYRLANANVFVSPRGYHYIDHLDAVEKLSPEIDESALTDQEITYIEKSLQSNPKRLENQVNIVKSHVHSTSNKRLLDIGCGGGLFLSKLKNDGATVMGIELK